MNKNYLKPLKLLAALIFLLTLCWFVTQIVKGTSIMPSQQVTIATRTLYKSTGTYALPDSVRILVLYNGASVHEAWYNSGDAQAAAVGSVLVFTDQLQDIDGAGGAGHYVIMGRAYDADSSTYTEFIYNFDVGLVDEVENLNGWNPGTDPVASVTGNVGGILSDVTITAGSIISLWNYPYRTLTNVNKRVVYVKVDGDPDSSGLSPLGAVDSPLNGYRKCAGCGVAGCSVVVAAGNYPAAQCSTVTIDSINYGFYGAGRGKTILNQLAGQDFFSFNNSDYIGGVVAGFTLVGSESQTAHGIEVLDGDGMYIHHNTFTGVNEAITFGANADYAVINYNHIFDSEGDHIKYFGDFFIIHDNVLDSLEGDGADCIAINGTAEGGAIFNNYINTTKGTGIHLFFTDPDYPSGILIANNFVSTAADDDSAFYPTYSSHNRYVANHGEHYWAFEDGDTTNTLEKNLELLHDTTHQVHVTAQAVKAKTDNLPADPASETNVDANETKIDAINAKADTMKIYLGAGDGFRNIMRPFGQANKDSTFILNDNDTLATLYYFHTGSIIDSTRLEIR